MKPPTQLKTTILVLFCLLTIFTQAQQTITISGQDIQDVALVLDTRSGKEYVANTNYGTYPRITATAWTNSNSNVFQRTLFSFNLLAIPIKSTVQSATLYLYSDPAYSSSSAAESNSQLSGSNAVYLEQLIGPWDQSIVTWNSQPSTTTTGRIYITPSTSTTENRQVNLTSLVQAWVNDPGSNYGLKMYLENEVKYRARNYASTDHSNTALRPKLIITYVPSALGGECGTEDLTEAQGMALPWYGNETFLPHYYDSVQAADPISNPAARVPGNIENPRRRVPIIFWVYQVSPGVPGGSNPIDFPNEASIQQFMDAVNNAAKTYSLDFRFFVKNIIYVSEQASLTLTDKIQAQDICNRHTDRAVINVHVIDDVALNSQSDGVTYGELNSIFVERATASNGTGVLPHEIGHYFGLQHTFIYHDKARCFREPVTRGVKITPCPNGGVVSKRCLFTGDFLCDTDADPGMDKFGDFNLSTCVWDPKNSTDVYGDIYHPDRFNYMAYGNGLCRSHFSPTQVKLMFYYGLHFLNHTSWYPTEDNRFDIFEPDNSAIASRLISVGETQSHTFHSAARFDNVDWLYLQHPSLGRLYNYKLVITQVTNGAVGQVNFYIGNGDGTAGARLSGITSSTSGSQVTYLIPCSLLTNGQTYKIEIPRAGGTATQDYDVTLTLDDNGVPTPSFSGPTALCLNGANGVYTVQNVPAGATITWSKNANLSYISGQGTTTYTVKATASGAGQVSVNVSNSCGSTGQMQTAVTIVDRAYASGDYPIQGYTTICTNALAYYSAPQLPAATIYNWTWPSTWTYLSGQGTPNLAVQAGSAYGSATITLRVDNKCYAALSPAIFTTTVNNCGSFAVMSSSPNPASSQLTIQSDTENNSTPDANSSSQNLKHQKVEVFSVTLIDRNNLTVREANTNSGKLVIDTSDIPEGLYFLRIKTSDQIYSEKVLIKK
jgi:hypothetical protein